MIEVNQLSFQTLTNSWETIKGDELHNHIRDNISISTHRECRLAYVTILSQKRASEKRAIDLDDSIVDDDDSTDEFSFVGNCYTVTEEGKDLIIGHVKNDEKISEETRDFIICSFQTTNNISYLRASYHAGCKRLAWTSLKMKKRSSTNDRKISIAKKIWSEKNFYIPCEKFDSHKLQDDYQNLPLIEHRRGRKTACFLANDGFDLHQNLLNNSNKLSNSEILKKSAEIFLSNIENYECDFKVYPPSAIKLEKAKKYLQNLMNFQKTSF